MTEATCCPRIRAFMWLVLKLELSSEMAPRSLCRETDPRALAPVRNVNGTEREGFLFEKGIANYYDAY